MGYNERSEIVTPDWTSLLANQAPNDVGTAGLNGSDRQPSFRAIAYQASDPTNFVISNIVTIP